MNAFVLDVTSASGSPKLSAYISYACNIQGERERQREKDEIMFRTEWGPKRSTYKALTRVIPYRHKPLVKPAVIAIPRRATYEALARVIPHGLTVGLGVFGSFGSFGWLSWFAPLVSAV